MGLKTNFINLVYNLYILSDNGTVFTATETQKYGNEKEIIWKFNLDLSPWWGGFFERMVGLVKRCIKKSIGRKRLRIIDLQTLTHRIELILNNRPLSSPDEEENPILTPSHILYGRKREDSRLNQNDENKVLNRSWRSY